MNNEANKIPPRPTEIVDMVPSIDYVNHIVAVNEVAVEALKNTLCYCNDMPWEHHDVEAGTVERGDSYVCGRCRVLRQIEESGWQP